MIQANELRINNWVQVGESNYKIWGITNEYPFLESLDFEAKVIGYKNLQPITLTEEWLVKFGFEIDNEDFFELDISEFSLIWIGYIALNFNGTYIMLDNEIKYVHTLQNLYFALTGEELTLKS